MFVRLPPSYSVSGAFPSEEPAAHVHSEAEGFFRSRSHTQGEMEVNWLSDDLFLRYKIHCNRVK